MKFKQFMRNTKAISPIFATLILIAIAVIAGVVVYMFTSGYLSSMAGNTGTLSDKLSVPGASEDLVIATNMGDKDTMVTTAILKDSSGTVIGSLPIAADATEGSLNPIPPAQTSQFDLNGLTAPTVTGAYTITLTTGGGGSFVSAPFTVVVP
jgi:flagellin-like protein